MPEKEVILNIGDLIWVFCGGGMWSTPSSHIGYLKNNLSNDLELDNGSGLLSYVPKVGIAGVIVLLPIKEKHND